MKILREKENFRELSFPKILRGFIFANESFPNISQRWAKFAKFAKKI